MNSTIFSPLDGADGLPDYSATAKSHSWISFGVELEFALATLLPDDTNNDPIDTRQVYGIVGPEGYPIPEYDGYNADEPMDFVETMTCNRMQCTRHLRDFLDKHFGSCRAKAAGPDEEETTQYKGRDFYTITQDPSVEGPESETNMFGSGTYDWQPVEINSCAYVYTPGSLLEVESVCCHLINNYRCFAGTGTPSTASRTSGLHVHIGFGDKGFEYLKDLKNLMAIYWIFEPQLYSLLSSHRLKSTHCQPVRAHSALARELASTKPKGTDTDALARIMRANSVQELVSFFKGSKNGHRLGLNLSNLAMKPPADREGEARKTVEFRIHEASLQPDVVSHWIQFCARLVMFACLVNQENLFLWLKEHSSDENARGVAKLSAPELLEALKMPEQAAFYKEKIERMKGVVFLPSIDEYK